MPLWRRSPFLLQDVTQGQAGWQVCAWRWIAAVCLLNIPVRRAESGGGTADLRKGGTSQSSSGCSRDGSY